MKKINLINVEEIVLKNNFKFLYRFPLSLIPHLGYLDNIKGQKKALESAGIEIQIEDETDSIEIDFYANESECEVIAFIGDFEYKRFVLEANKPTTLEVKRHERMTNIGLNMLHYETHSPLVYRFLIGAGASVGYRIKNEDEYTNLPINSLKKICAYGSSITQGVGAITSSCSYLQTFAKYASLTVLNKGMSGTCFCEEEMIKYLSTVECDAYLFELGCNMRGLMNEAEFANRITNLFGTILKTKKPIYVIDMLSFFNEHYSAYNVLYKEKSILFSKILNFIAKNMGDIKIYKSLDLMDRVDCISYDMLHPSTTGHFTMGKNLAQKFRNI